MSDSTDAPTMEARIEALFQQTEEDGVQNHGLLRTYVRAALGELRQRGRVYINEAGTIRILSPDDSGGFTPATRDDARAAALLAKEIADAAPEEALMDLVAQHEEDQAQRLVELARDPSYRL